MKLDETVPGEAMSAQDRLVTGGIRTPHRAPVAEGTGMDLGLLNAILRSFIASALGSSRDSLAGP